MAVWTSTSTTLTFVSSASSCSSSSSCAGLAGSSATHHLAGLHLLGVDVLERPAFPDPSDLPFRGVRGGDRQRDAELVGHGADPFGPPLAPRAGRRDGRRS